jgi:ribosomal protein S27E
LTTVVTCEKCGNRSFDLTRYRSLMLVSYDKALFTLTCPQCGSTVSAMCTIPDSLRGKIIEGAHQVDAGMGRDL